MEERRTAELMSDFDDYEIGREEDNESDDGGADKGTDSGEKGARKKKKAR
jgi:hypothetical protein